MKPRSGGSGPALWLRHISARYRAYAPFTDLEVRKGVFTPFARAPRHRIVTYRIARAGIIAPWRIALVADLHTGSFSNDLERLAAIMREVNALEPDLVLLLGDYMNMIGFAGGHVAPEVVGKLLKFPMAKHGVFAVLGNHDWEYGFDAVRDMLRGQGVRVLENEVAAVTRAFLSSRPVGGEPASAAADLLHLAGLSDDRLGNSDPSILRNIPEGAPSLVMAHDPAAFFDVPEGTLMVSGHMHGGQIRLPGLPPPLVPHGRAPRRWARGHIRERGGDLVVSAGLGCSGLPFRLFSPPEIVMLELVPLV